MKRLTTLFIAIIFLMGAVFTAPVSFAAKDKKQGENDSDKKNAREVEKDTSWFDYENPKTAYQITTEGQLIGLASLVNEKQIERWKPTRLENFEGVTFTLTKDIQLTKKWNPIGTGTVSHFAGVFDGDGHTISGLDVDSFSGAAGFFGFLTGEVRDLTLKGKIKSQDGSCGAFVGQLNSTGRVVNCTSQVQIEAKDKTGGIVGYNDGGKIEGCINKGAVSGTLKVGGIVGENWGGTLLQCGNVGRVTSSVRGVATYGTGGVAGRSVSSTAEISECYNTGELHSYTEATGGVVGYTNAIGSTIINSYNTGTIAIKAQKNSMKKELTKTWVGGVAGIVGTEGVVISHCYNAGEIKNADVAGGVVGRYIVDPHRQIENKIENNYYLSSVAEHGVGQYDDLKGFQIKGGTAAVSSGNLISLSGSLGIAYRNNSSGMYATGGYPALRWQPPVDETQKSYLPNIPKNIQVSLDSYLVKTADRLPKGHMVLRFFDLKDNQADTLILFQEAKEKAKKIKKANELKVNESKEKDKN